MTNRFGARLKKFCRTDLTHIFDNYSAPGLVKTVILFENIADHWGTNKSKIQLICHTKLIYRVRHIL
jgi:hypothetical protein